MKDLKAEAESSYAAGRKAYSLNSPKELFASRDLFRQAIGFAPDWGPPRATLAFTLVQSWLQGWDGELAMDEAGDQAKLGQSLAPDDASCNAHLALYLLNRGEYEAALDLYRQAAAMANASSETRADWAEAEIYAGRIDEGIAILRELVEGKDREKVYDWHRWDLAWGWFLKGREQAKGSDDKALDQLNRMQVQVDDPAYMVDCLLLRAVVEARLGMTDQAGDDLARFLARRTDWTLFRERRSVHFRRPQDELWWLDGCKEAGLPG